MVVALLALFLSLGSGAYAAVKVNGRSITKRSISHTRMKRNTLTGAEIRESTLGTVASARRADRATSAAAADRAGTANDAGALGGRPATAYAHLTGAVNADGTRQFTTQSYTAQRLGTGHYELLFPQSAFGAIPVVMVTPINAQVTGTFSYAKPVDGRWRVDVSLSKDAIFSFTATEIAR